MKVSYPYLHKTGTKKKSYLLEIYQYFFIFTFYNSGLIFAMLIFWCRGVGKWILKLMQGFFDTGSGSSEPEDVTKKGTSIISPWLYTVFIDCIVYSFLLLSVMDMFFL